MADRFELAAVAMDHAQMPMIVTDPRQPDSPIVLANQAFLDLTGYGATEVIGRNPRFMQGPQTAPETVAKIRDALREERDFTVEILNYTKDGAAFWNHLHVSRVHGEDGELLYYFASHHDVTDLRKVHALEANEHRLLREIDHRARNVLAVVNGIVRLSRSDDPKTYAVAVQRRVDVLARAHTLLSERGWRDIDLVEVVGQQIWTDPVRRISCGGAPVMVSALAVQPLALVLHELLFNALIHGALESGGGIDLRWAPDPETGGFVMTWAETTPIDVDRPRRDGFGAMMIQAMISRQLRGQVERRWADDGLTVTLRVPAFAAPRDAVPA